MNLRGRIDALRQTPPLMLASGCIALGALIALLAAHGFEYLGGYDPCPLCLTERIAYYAAIPGALLARSLAYRGQSALSRALLGLVALGFLVNAGIGVNHSGVEWRWWEGTATCAGSAFEADTGNLLQSLSETRVIACDEAPWRFLGLSFAGWSAVISAGLAAIGVYGVVGSRGQD